MREKREIRTVLTTVPYTDWHLDRLREAFEPAKLIHADKSDRAGISAALKEADVAVLGGDLDDQILKEGVHLKWIHCDHSGINNSARPEIFERGIILTGSAGRSAPVLAEHALYLTLSLVYNAYGLLEDQRAHRWKGIPGYESVKGLYSKTMGIVGIGHTGRQLAVHAKAMGMRILGYDRDVADVPPGVDKLYFAQRGETVDELLRESDVIVLCVRMSDATFHMVGKKQLEMMKSTAYLINIGRGPLVDTPALIDALKEGVIAGAGLDTFEQEPLPPESPLWDAPHTVLTPHCTPEVPDLAASSQRIIFENIRRYRDGEPMLNAVDFRDVYTKQTSA